MRKRLVALASLLFAASACETGSVPPGDSSSGAQAVRASRNEPISSAGATCATMRDVAASDLVAVDGDVLYQLDEAEGFVVTDVADVESPRELARVASVGTPLALYLRPPVAWVVFVDWAAGAKTVLRAVDVRRPDAPRVVGEASVPGVASGTALIDGVLYVLAGTPATLSSHRIAGDGVARADELRLDGAAAALAASPAGLAAVATLARGVSVTFVDLPAADRPGALFVRASRAIDGGFPAWERDVVNVDEEQAVRLVTCATSACLPDDDVSVRTIDFGRGAEQVRASMPIGVARGVPVARFSDDWLYVGDGPDLRVVRLAPVPRVVARTRVPGTIAAIRPNGDHLLVVGTEGAPATGVRVFVADVDVRAPLSPRLRGAASFGDDWTWTRAADDDRAISVDPSSSLVATPFATFRAKDGRYATGARLVSLSERAPSLGAALPADGHVERVVFVRGRPLAVGAGRVTPLVRRGAGELGVQ